MKQDLSAIATGLTRGSDGVWYARASSSPVDYPDEANAVCFAIEEGSFWFQHRNAVIVEVVSRFPPPGFIADIGAGNGYVSLGLARAGFETLVVEPGAAGIRNARSRGLEPLVRSTLHDAGFLPASLPAAGLFDVLEHMPDDEAVLNELARLIVAGGRLYVTVPAFEMLWSSEDDLVGHHRRYTVRSLSARLRAAGFIPEYGTYLFSILPLPVLLFRSVPSWFGARRRLEADRVRAELQPSDSAALGVVRFALARERALIQKGWRIPLGSSCFVVARKA